MLCPISSSIQAMAGVGHAPLPSFSIPCAWLLAFSAACLGRCAQHYQEIQTCFVAELAGWDVSFMSSAAVVFTQEVRTVRFDVNAVALIQGPVINRHRCQDHGRVISVGPGNKLCLHRLRARCRQTEPQGSVLRDSEGSAHFTLRRKGCFLRTPSE